MLRVLLLAFACVAAYDAGAARFEFKALRNGERIAGAEVCFYPVGPPSSPITRALSSEMRCLSADHVIDVPKGDWFYYLRHESGWATVTPVELNNPGAPEREFFQSEEVMVPATSVDISTLRQRLGPQERLAMYVSNSGRSTLPMFIPVALDRDTVLVPKQIPVLFLRLHRAQIVDTTRPFVADDEANNAPTFASTSEKSRVLTWVEYDESDRQPGAHWNALPAPSIFLETGEGNIAPAIALGARNGTDGALVLFNDVPAGPATIRLGGAFWRQDLASLRVLPGQLNMPARGLRTGPAGAIDVAWRVAGSPARLDPNCDPRVAPEPPTLGVRLLTCKGLQPTLQADEVDMASCRPLFTREPLDAMERTARFEGVPAGTYIVEVIEPAFVPRVQIVVAEKAQTIRLDLVIDTFEIFGRITFNGKPLRSRLAFATGAATSDDAGQYYASLSSDPRDLPVLVLDCDTGQTIHTAVPSSPLDRGRPFDITIESNVLKVRVIDKGTDAPISGGVVQVIALTDDDAGHFLTGAPRTDADGLSLLRNAPDNRPIVVCALAEGYARSCSEALQVRPGEQRAVSVQLESTSRRSRILAPRQFNHARAYFVHPDLGVLEWAPVKPEGHFEFRHRHQDPTYLVVVSDQPLLVLPVGENVPDVIPWPLKPARDVEVSMSEKRSATDATIGLFVGGRYVPQVVMGLHQSLRGLQTEIYGRGPLLIPAILETGPIVLMLGPPPGEPPPHVPKGVDVFTHPAFSAGLPRALVHTRTVVFE
jgi:hypothetical protein